MKKQPFDPVRELNVEMDLAGAIAPVGRLAWKRDERRAYFQYDRSFLERGLELSPFKLPLGEKLVAAPLQPFEGLHGLFNDSLPDGWGRLLLDRRLKQLGILPSALGPLDRLAYVGSRGPGALRYRPARASGARKRKGAIELDRLAEEVQAVIEDGDAEEVIESLLELGGSSGGARPKILVGVSDDRRQIVAAAGDLPDGYRHWIIKFKSSSDFTDAGPVEYAYAEMARASGIEIAPTHLFPSRSTPGFFGTPRFDRRENAHVHLHSACGLLHADHRMPSIGYADLLKATRRLTRNQEEVDRVFRRMVFNAMAHNRDDHTKNHAFLLEANGEWKASPAFDLCFSAGAGYEHALDIAGEGRNPTGAHLAEVARTTGVADKTLRECVDQVRAAVARWPRIAAAAGVSKATTTLINDHLKSLGPWRP